MTVDDFMMIMTIRLRKAYLTATAYCRNAAENFLKRRAGPCDGEATGISHTRRPTPASGRDFILGFFLKLDPNMHPNITIKKVDYG